MILDWNALAHRALASAALASVLPRTPGTRRVLAGPLSILASQTGAYDLVVTVDDGGDTSLPASLPTAPIVALVVSSEAAFRLVRAARDDAGPTRPERDDAFARALSWADGVRDAPLAPPVRPARISAFVSAANAIGLALVEPDLSAAIRVRSRRLSGASVDRAVLATIALGATAKPLLFVPARAAPKGIPKLRVERLAEASVRAHPSAGLPSGEISSLGVMARRIVSEIAPERIAAKELLRRARERYAEAARTRGERFTAGSDDSREVLRAVHAAHVEGHVEIELEDALEMFVAG